MQKAILAIKAEQERADHRFALVVTETADHAVRAAIVLHFLHSAALARAIVEIATLGDDAVEHGSDVLATALPRSNWPWPATIEFAPRFFRYRWAKSSSLRRRSRSGRCVSGRPSDQQADRRELEARAFLPPA